MTLERFRQLCLQQPGATEQIQWGADAVFKVGGKMFAVACTDAAYPNAKACSFKCDDEGFAELCEREGVGPGALSGAREVGGARHVERPARPRDRGAGRGRLRHRPERPAEEGASGACRDASPGQRTAGEIREDASASVRLLGRGE